MQFCGLMSTYACNNVHEDSSSNSSISGPAFIAPLPTVEYPFTDPNPSAIVLDYTDPATKHYIDSTNIVSTTSFDWFSTEMEHWSALGYEFALEHSFTIEGDVDGLHLFRVSYVLRFTADTALWGLMQLSNSLISIGLRQKSKR